jgi:hypothetical protein
MTGTSVLKDTFSTGSLVSYWPASTGVVSAADGVASIQCDTTTGNALKTNYGFTVKNDTFDFVIVTLPDPTGVTSFCYLQGAVVQGPAGANFLAIRVDTFSNWLFCRFGATDAIPPVAFDPTWVRLRIREGTAAAGNLAAGTAGTTYFDVSPTTDDTAWVNLGSAATPAWVSATSDSAMQISASRDGGTTDTAQIDNVNIVPPPPPVPDAPWGLAAVPGDSAALLSWGAPVTPPDSYTGTADDGQGNVFTRTVPGTFTGWLMGGMTNDLTYTITLVATNADGDSPPSDPVTVTPVLGAPPLLDPNLPTPGPDETLLPPAPVPPPEVDPDALPYPIPGVRQKVSVSAPEGTPSGFTTFAALSPALSTVPGTPANKVGHVQAMWLEAANGQVLYVLPSRGGLWLTAFDPGYPVVAEVTQGWPDRDGVLDYTDRYGPRNLVINLLAEPWRGRDKNGVLQPAAAWAALVRNWSSLDNKLRLHFQLTGQRPVYCDVRTSNYTGPITMEELGRFTIPITWGLTSADGMLYQDIYPPGYQQDPQRPGWYMVAVAASFGGTGINFGGGSTWVGGAGLVFDGGNSIDNLTTGINFGGQSSFGSPIIALRKNTVGSRRTAPIITISGGACTGPIVSVYGGPDGQTLRARLQFSTSLVLSASDTMLIDVGNRRVVRNPDRYGNGEPLYRYLTGAVDWRNFTINPGEGNGFAFDASANDPGTTASFSYRATSV